LQEPRLADAGLAHDHEHLSLAGPGLLETLDEESELALPADEARAAGRSLGETHQTIRPPRTYRARFLSRGPDARTAGNRRISVANPRPSSVEQFDVTVRSFMHRVVALRLHSDADIGTTLQVTSKSDAPRKENR
jgi:hypothetical protein